MTDLSADQVLNAIHDAILDVAPEVADELERLDEHADLWETLELDSMDHQSVLAGLVERTGVEIDEKDYGQLRSLAAVVGHLVATASAD